LSRGKNVVDKYIERCSNWGRWGDDDELGTLNLVGPEQIKAAGALVKQGRVISMTLPLDSYGPQVSPFRSNPRLFMSYTGTDYLAGKQDPMPGDWGPANGLGFSDDWLITPNQAGTQWDALAHVFYDGQMYNGVSAAEVDPRGAARNGIQNYSGRLVMRGVFLDIPRLLGVDSLEPGQAIASNELDAACARQGVTIRSGDAVIVRTGFLEKRRGDWGDYAGGAAPGLSLETVDWLHTHEVAAVAGDTWGLEVRPNEIDFFQPFHVVAIAHMGLAVGEIFDLGALAADCAGDGVYEFMFVASPLPITGAVGSPVSALAIK
jgi:kynurenine formamidase